MSKNKRVESRQAYTLFDLLGDFGGFNDAIYFLLSLPMGMYSSSMYTKHIASLINVTKKPKKKSKHNKASNLQKKLHHVNDLNSQDLDDNDK